jgi:hypothetical protein
MWDAWMLDSRFIIAWRPDLPALDTHLGEKQDDPVGCLWASGRQPHDSLHSRGRSRLLFLVEPNESRGQV